MSLSSRKSPRRSARRATTTSSGGESLSATSRNPTARVRGTSVSSLSSARAAGPFPTTSDVFEVVADGNADMLADMIDFSGANHLCKLRSKKQEDYGRNLLHCAVTNGQSKSLQVLLRHEVFDPNEVDSVYTRSTPMMEAVKLGRLDLIDSLLRAGGRLDVQDVNGDSALHWAAHEVSAAFLRQVLLLARKHGSSSAQLLTVLQLKNNNGDNAADVGANDVSRDSIRRLVSGEEEPGLTTRKSTSTAYRSSQHHTSDAELGLPHRKNTSSTIHRSSQPHAGEGARASYSPRRSQVLTHTSVGSVRPRSSSSTASRPRPRSAARAEPVSRPEHPAADIPTASVAVAEQDTLDPRGNNERIPQMQGTVDDASARVEPGLEDSSTILEPHDAAIVPKVKGVAACPMSEAL